MGLTNVLKRTIAGVVSFRPRYILVSKHDNGQHSVDHVTVIPLFRKPFAPHETSGPLDDHASDKLASTSSNEDVPAGTQKKAPTIIQLFYDLFFVANLTAFNTVHEVNDVPTLKSYIGFFSILWFTWLQVAMFDVRFSSDSVFERVCKALQLGVMLGLAIIGPAYNVGFESGNEEEDALNTALSVKAFKALSLLLMFSRLVLCFQYGAVLLWIRKLRGAILPLALTILTSFLAAMVFLGLFFAFNNGNANSLRAVDGWYATIGVEAGCILFFSAIDRFASFRQSYIVERLGLLTLILLGEGVIGLCTAVQKLSSHSSFSSDIIGMIVCAAVVIYFLWVFYFDQVEAEKVGTIRQLVWILLHFPYHVSVLLVLEGASQMTLWQKFQDVFASLGDDLFAFPEITSNSLPDLRVAVDHVNATVLDLAKSFTPPGKLRLEPPWVNDSFTAIFDLANDPAATGNLTYINRAITDYVFDIYATCTVYAGEHLGFEAPIKKVNTAGSDLEVFGSIISDTFDTVFGYFFFCAGTVLILNALLSTFGKRHKLRGEHLGASIRALIGIALSIVALVSFDQDYNVQVAFNAFTDSAWMLPTVTLAFLLVIVIDMLLVWGMRRTLRGYDMTWNREPLAQQFNENHESR